MRKRIAIALVAVAFMVGLLVALMLALFILRRSSAPVFANTPSVVLQIQSLSELVTVKYVIEKVVFEKAESATTIGQLLPGQDDQILLLAHGIVKAGVNLSQLKDGDVQATGKKIRIDLPRAIVTDGYLDENATQVLDRRTGLFRAFDKKLEQQARQFARTEIIRAARQSGIEREAGERAREQLTNFLKTLGYTEVEIRTRDK